MSKQHDLWCFNIGTEIAELLADRNVTVDDAKRILYRLIQHADDHTGFVPFTPKVRGFVPIGQNPSQKAPSSVKDSAEATKPPPAKRKSPTR